MNFNLDFEEADDIILAIQYFVMNADENEVEEVRCLNKVHKRLVKHCCNIAKGVVHE
jgi:hypothetical protein